MSDSIHDIPVTTIDGRATTLREHAGKVLLIVNVASKCGLTPQYAALEKLHERLGEQGFTVLGFPANDFAGQEPGDEAEIMAFCTSTYGVRFPMYAKIRVTGADKHPLYAHLTAAAPSAAGRDAMEASLRGYGVEPAAKPEVLWNFEKFLVDKLGCVVGRFAPDMAPDAPALVSAIETEVAKA
ncbi:MAG: glutathione peroxidase [Rhodocyclaceae bacterium]|nr:glutathione peroxidase [Rhodocyclaceae bacterium]MBK9310373.1 glutathione peroxidase [Rhodocyclaceae bacterium]MBK9954555.1 glutathione peroxidase [Rhodocyclaceae bacterium]